jgi:hypothetical protein
MNQKDQLSFYSLNCQENREALKPLRPFIVSIVFSILLAPSVAVGRTQEEESWESVAPGIEFREFNLPAPNNVFVARMDRNNTGVALESSIGQGRLSGGGETVSGMAARYDGAINYWGQAWGNRNQVAVAINGYYYNQFTGVPFQGVVHSGWYSKLFDPCEAGAVSGSGLAWKLDRTLFIGESVTNAKHDIVYIRDGDDPVQEFDGINIPRGANQFILYTPQFDQTTKTEGGTDSIEVLVQMTSPSLINSNVNFIPRGKIVKIFPNKGSTPIPFDHVVLSMHGTSKAEFEALGAQAGDEIGIHQRINKCLDSPTFDWNNTYASIGGAFYFLKDGVIQGFPDDNQANVRDPRTAIAYNDSYIYFIVVDGRDKVRSLGMTISELAQFAKDTLSATYGVAQDGGGSSTMVVNGKVVNNTFCNIVTCEGNIYLPLAIRGGGKSQAGGVGAPVPRSEETPQPAVISGDGFPLTEAYYEFTQTASGTILQRLVANGMMMVVVQPKDVSKIFSLNQSIKTLLDASVRLGPGTNYAVLQTVPANTPGIIYGEDNGLNGVWAKGAYWWRVLLELPGGIDVIGWVSESYITVSTP